MTDIKNLVVTSDDFETIKNIGIEFQKKTVESILAFSRVVYVLKEKCEKEEDDSFNLKANEYWGLSASGASQFAKTGKNADKLVAYSASLPASSRALYELTQLSLTELDEHINLGDITPSSTVNDVKAIKETVKEEKQSKKPTKAKDGEEKEVNPFAVDVTDDEGNAIEATLVDTSDEAKPSNKMTILEALAIFDVDMNQLYMDVLQKGEKDKTLLDKAFYVITGEKL